MITGLDAGRQGQVEIGRQVFYRRRDLDRGGLGGLGHGQVDRGPAIETGIGLGLGKAARDRGHIAEPERAAGGVGAQHDLRDIFRLGACAPPAQPDIALAGLDRAARLIDEIIPERGVDLPERDPQRREPMRIDLDPKLPVAVAGHADAGHARDLPHPPARLFRVFIQFRLGQLAVKGQGDHREPGANAVQLGRLGFGGQIVHPIQQGVGRAHKIIHIGAGLELDINAGAALAAV